jgi:DNA-binding CsgD family transcriptional regulator
MATLNEELAMVSLASAAQVRVRNVHDIRRAAEVLRQLTATQGLRVALTHDIGDSHTPVDADGRVLASEVFGWSDDDLAWWRNTSLALSSPLAHACRLESDIFWANANGIYTRMPNARMGAVSLNAFEKRACVRAAIVVPVHLPFGQIGAISFVSQDPEKSDLSQEYKTLGEVLKLIGWTFVSSYARAVWGRQRLPVNSVLTKREIECLRLAATGLTDGGIADALGRRRATIRFHLDKAAVKLDAVNKCQAIFKAAQLGYLSPVIQVW